MDIVVRSRAWNDRTEAGLPEDGEIHYRFETGQSSLLGQKWMRRWVEDVGHSQSE